MNTQKPRLWQWSPAVSDASWYPLTHIPNWPSAESALPIVTDFSRYLVDAYTASVNGVQKPEIGDYIVHPIDFTANQNRTRV